MLKKKANTKQGNTKQGNPKQGNTKQGNTQQRSYKPSAKRQTGLRWSVLTLAKLSFAVFCVLALVIIYLDAKVQKTFDGQRWRVPVQVFGQVLTLKVGDKIDLKAIVQSLDIKGYKKVLRINAAKQYALSNQGLSIYQQDFDFPTSKLNTEILRGQRLIVKVKANQISALFSDDIPTKSIQLEPKLLARLVPNNKEDRLLVSLESVPNQLLDTLLLIEDRDFYHHKGISPLGILRALYHNLRAGRTVQGGSTLTQQLVKNMFLTRHRTLARKVQEALMALVLEFRYSKDELLEAYLNEVYLGQNFANGIYGFGLAAQFYFSQDLDQLNSAQVALLIAQVKGPSYYDPWRYPKRAKQRRDLILRLMLEHHMITTFEFEQAANSTLSVRKNKRTASQSYPAYLQLVKKELNALVSTQIQTSGIKVFTGFSHRSQQLLEQTVSTELPRLENKVQQNDLQVAMIVTDIASGEIRALSGGRVAGYAGFNRALTAKRPVGSLIKPAIYLAALERYEQYNLASILLDQAITLKNGKGRQWQPKNYDGKYRGRVPLIDGLVHSLNIPTINLGMSLGLDNIAEAVNLLGYDKKIHLRPSLLLGAINMSPMEINQTYLAFAAKGLFKKTHAVNKVISAQGDILFEFNHKKEQRLSSNAAYLIDYALTKVTQSGTAKSLSWRLKNTVVAGKTGTSNDLRDSWFIGYDNKHLVTTWLGKDNNKPTGLTGSSGALALFSHFIKAQGSASKKIMMPETISMTLFEKKTGSAVSPQCEDTIRYPAVNNSVQGVVGCLQEKKPVKSWFEKLFGD